MLLVYQSVRQMAHEAGAYRVSPAGEDGSAAEVELQRNCVQMMGCEMLLEDEACRENIVVSLTSDVRKAHVDVEMSKPSGPLAQSMF